MPYLHLDGRQHTLVSGDNAVGSGGEARIPLAVGGSGGIAAVVHVSLDGSAVIRRTTQTVRVNGVQLGEEPAPLIHGDKIEIDGHEMFFGDDRRAGNTQTVARVKPTSGVHARTPTPVHAVSRALTPKPFAAVGSTGGRLVSLVDGREYLIPLSGLVIGRDPTCDVVVPSGEVSRKHATISMGGDGYVVTDTSANGVFVNGTRVRAPTVLARGAVLRIADEEFRFYADPAQAARPLLATMSVSSGGVLKGRVFDLRSTLVHVGRGRHNDVVLPDESVSDSHAKMQRREAGWVVVDMESTNGTYVGGRRITGETLLDGAPDVRFGGVKLIFSDVGGDRAEPAPTTRAIAAWRGTSGRPTPAAGNGGRLTPVSKSVLPVTADERNTSTIVWVVTILALATGVLLLLTYR